MKVKRGCGHGSNSSCYSKQGQVTVFIIIGIVILFAFAGILYVTKVVTKDSLEAEGTIVREKVPAIFQPIQSFTKECLKTVARDGLLIMGEQGGYIFPDILGEFSSLNPTDSVGLFLDPLRVPYWHYNSVPNQKKNVDFASFRPALYREDDPLFSIEAQLGRYISEQLETCLDSYNSFYGRNYYVESTKGRKVEVSVTDQGVNILLEMPLKIEFEGARGEMDSFFAQVPINLKHYYKIADLITQTEKEYHFLEQQGLELLSVYSAKNPANFPPVSSFSFNLFSPLSWNEMQLEQKYKNLLISYVPMLRFLGSENFYHSSFPEGNLLAQKIADNMVIPLFGAEDLQISFDYFDWKPYFATNSQDGIIKPEHLFINYELLSFGQQRYETHYDISYPVLITLKDDFAFGGDGFNFVFALESNIRNNEPGADGYVRENYPQPVTPIICDKEHKSTELLKTIVVDSFTKEPLELVKVGFTIPEQAECEIGITNEYGVVEERYPAVYGGMVNFINQDYLTSFYPIDTYKYQGKEGLIGYSIAGAEAKVVELHKKQKVNVSVKKKEIKKCVTPLLCNSVDLLLLKDIDCDLAPKKCFFNEGESLLLKEPIISFRANSSLTYSNDYYYVNADKDLEENEKVFFNLQRVSGFHDEIIDSSFFASVEITGNQQVEIELVPGIYQVQAFATLDEKIVIPKDRRCFRYDLNIPTIIYREEEECFHFEGAEFEQYLSGNLVWETPENYLVITPEDLYTSKELTLRLPAHDLKSIPETFKVKDYNVHGLIMEDLQVVNELSKLAQESPLRESLEPTFS